jgi:RimJ/RimL family protein N-acetyltransferase
MKRVIVPEIQTERLLLRRLALGDAVAMYSYRSDPAIMRYQTWHPISEREVRAFIKKNKGLKFDSAGTWFQLGIYLKPTQELIGDIGIHFLPSEKQQVEIGFTLSSKYQHKGHASEAVRHVLNYLFADLHKHRVIASVDPGNDASIKLLETIGMHKEAHFRKSIWTGKEWADDIIYALLDSDWK